MAMIGLDGSDNYTNYDERTAGGYTGQGSITTPGIPITQVSPQSPYDQVAAVYQSGLGRAPESQQAALDWWSGTGGDINKIIAGIAASPEGKAYAERSSAPSAPTPSANGTDSRSVLSQIFQKYGLDPNNPGYGLANVDYFAQGGGGHANPSDLNYWTQRTEQEIRKALYGEQGGLIDKPTANYTGGNIFDDPATAPFMQLLTQRINALNTPYQNPQLDQLNGYLQQYFQKLQGPAYTPQQMDLLQTQALDPLTRERDAALQRAREQASARGIGANSGITQDRQNQLERQFEQLRTQQQANFATNAVNLDRVNAQQAAGVAQLLANIEQTAFNQNEQRANQALDLAGQVPALARQRLLDAAGIVNQNNINPTSLLSLAQSANQFDSGQTQQYILGLAQLLPSLLRVFGVGG